MQIVNSFVTSLIVSVLIVSATVRTGVHTTVLNSVPLIICNTKERTLHTSFKRSARPCKYNSIPNKSLTFIRVVIRHQSPHYNDAQQNRNRRSTAISLRHLHVHSKYRSADTRKVTNLHQDVQNAEVSLLTLQHAINNPLPHLQLLILRTQWQYSIDLRQCTAHNLLDSGVYKEEKLCLHWRHCWQARDRHNYLYIHSPDGASSVISFQRAVIVQPQVRLPNKVINRELRPFSTLC